MSDTYFSDRESGPREPTSEEISENAWGGMATFINTLITKGAFADEYPEQCSDELGPIGTNEYEFSRGLKAEVPNMNWPLDPDEVPSTLAALDFLEFCHHYVAEPIKGDWHGFFQHYHLSFDQEAGRSSFRERINRILARNSLAYELGEDGRIRRLAPPILREILGQAKFPTGDSTLDGLLESARKKFLDPKPEIRKESLEKLWHAWERVKTLEGRDKKQSIAKLLVKASPEENFREVLNSDAVALTNIGNTFHIRHSEKDQVELERTDHFDYLFHRLFSLIWLLLNSRRLTSPV